MFYGAHKYVIFKRSQIPQGNHPPNLVAKFLFECFFFLSFGPVLFCQTAGKFCSLFFFFCGIIKRTHFKGFHAIACDAIAHYMLLTLHLLGVLFARRSQNLLCTCCFLHATSGACPKHVSVPVGTIHSLVLAFF